MKKKQYEKPSMKVVLLKHRVMLLQASVNATMNETWYEETI